MGPRRGSGLAPADGLAVAFCLSSPRPEGTTAGPLRLLLMSGGVMWAEHHRRLFRAPSSVRSGPDSGVLTRTQTTGGKAEKRGGRGRRKVTSGPPNPEIRSLPRRNRGAGLSLSEPRPRGSAFLLERLLGARAALSSPRLLHERLRKSLGSPLQTPRTLGPSSALCTPRPTEAAVSLRHFQLRASPVPVARHRSPRGSLETCALSSSHALSSSRALVSNARPPSSSRICPALWASSPPDDALQLEMASRVPIRTPSLVASLTGPSPLAPEQVSQTPVLLLPPVHKSLGTAR